MAKTRVSEEAQLDEPTELAVPGEGGAEVDNWEESPVAASSARKEDPFGVWSTETAGRKGLKVLLYGPSGAGKTRMAATFPRPLFLDLESGLRTTLQVKPVLRYPADPSQEIQTLDEVKKFYSLVKATTNPEFETIVVDSLNELQLLVLKNVLRRYDVNRQYDDQPTMADYGKLMRDFTTILRMFLKLPYHVVFTAVEVPREFPEQQVYPQFIGKKTGPDVQRMLEMIGYCYVTAKSDGTVEHLVSFQETPSYVAKDRMGIVRRDIPNDFAEILRNSAA